MTINEAVERLKLLQVAAIVGGTVEADAIGAVLAEVEQLTRERDALMAWVIRELNKGIEADCPWEWHEADVRKAAGLDIEGDRS